MRRMQPIVQWHPDVEVMSPDRTVRIRATVAGDVAVEVDDLGGHTEQTLAAQVRGAVRVALARLQDPDRRHDR